MPNVQVENFLLNTSNDQFSGMWKLTRAMKTAGWRYKASADGTSKDTTGNPNNDLWGPGVSLQTGGGGFTISAPTTTAYGGRTTVSGMPGAAFTSGSVGHFLKITGATNSGNNGTFLITNFISGTSVTIENPNAVSETTGVGGPSWTELSALSDTYPANITGASGSGAWWCAQGPSIIKVPIGASSPTGTFIRGENVTQSASGATGELLGVVIDSVDSQGYLVIAPRLSGTLATGVRGWSSLVTSTISGDRSGASVVPTATIIEFVREIVFWKNSTTNGHIYFQVIDQASEASTTAITGRFSTLAALATATATICPGGSGVGIPTLNGFPTIGSYVPMGQGGSGAATTGSNLWFNSSTAINLGKCQFLVTNCIEDASISADGTMTVAGGTPGTGTTTFIGWGFHRVDDQEDGDIDPYVWYMYDTRSANNRSRTLGNQSNAVTGGDMFTTGQILISGGTPFLGWRRRGYQSGGVVNGDSWLELQGFVIGNSTSIFANQNTGTPESVACTITTTKTREPLYVAAYTTVAGTPLKMRKGTLRWWYIVQGNAGTDTYDTKRWIQMSSTAFPIVVGPADGSTVPVNQ